MNRNNIAWQQPFPTWWLTVGKNSPRLSKTIAYHWMRCFTIQISYALSGYNAGFFNSTATSECSKLVRHIIFTCALPKCLKILINQSFNINHIADSMRYEWENRPEIWRTALFDLFRIKRLRTWTLNSDA